MRIKFPLMLVILMFAAGWMFGSGFALYEHGAKAISMGGAFTAIADDGSALFFNPAGIAFQKRSLFGSTAIILPSAEFDGENPFPGTGVNEKMPSQQFFPSSFAYTQSMNDRWSFAVGMYSPFGLGTTWENPDEFTGRFISTKAAIKAVRLQPTIAFKPTDNFSVALGFSYMASTLALEQYVPSINPYTQSITNVAHVRMDGGMDADWGFDFGLMYRFNEDWTFGLSYHSEISIDYTGTAKFDQIMTGYPDFDAIVANQLPLGDHDVETTIDFPALASVGIATTAIPNWTIAFDVDFAGWSSYEELPLIFVDIPELSSIRREEWDDSFNYRLGLEYRASDAWAIRGGLIRDMNPQPTEYISPILADSDRTWITLGCGYAAGSVIFDLGYMYSEFDERETEGVNHDGYEGTYKTEAHILGASLTIQF